MTGQLCLWAVATDTVRQVFAPPPELAERLRGVMAARFAVAVPKPPLLGPLRRLRQPLPVTPDHPSWLDAEAMLAGHFVTPDRLPAAWNLLAAWLDDLAAAAVAVPLSAADAERADYDLARAGVAPAQGLSALWRRRLDLPLTPLPGRATGATAAAEAQAIAQAWSDHWDGIEGSQAVLGPVHEFLLAHAGAAPELVAGWQKA
jgi:hypothetical protein